MRTTIDELNVFEEGDECNYEGFIDNISNKRRVEAERNAPKTNLAVQGELVEVVIESTLQQAHRYRHRAHNRHRAVLSLCIKKKQHQHRQLRSKHQVLWA